MGILRNKFWLLHILYFVCFYFYILYIVDPALYCLHQNPEFFTHYHYFKQFLTYPGGLVEYASLFLTTLSYLPWLGALVTTGLVLAITLLTIKVLKVLGVNKLFAPITLIPAILLTGLHGNFGHPIHYDIKLVLMLISFILFRPHPKRNIIWDLIFQCVLSGLLLYIGGIIPFGLFMLMVIIETMLSQKGWVRISRITAALVFTFALPYLFYDYLFMRGLYFEWQGLRVLMRSYTVNFVPFLPLLFYPFTAVSIPLINKITIPFKEWGVIKNRGVALLTSYSFIVQVVLIGSLALFMYGSIFDKHFKKVYQMGKLVNQKKWREAVNISEKCTPDDRAVHLIRNRALYHSGKLLDHMFDFPQQWGVDGLMFTEDEKKSRLFIPFSNIAYDMGEVNQSIRWSYEEIAHFGYTPHALKRLVLINIIKGNYSTAKKLLAMLKHTLFERQCADSYLKLIENPELLRSNEEIVHKRSLLAHKMFSHKDNIPHLTILVNLLFNTKNKMAFEYMMMCLLLEMNLDNFVTYLGLLETFEYEKMPRHFQEALCVYMAIQRDIKGVIKHYPVEPQIMRQFQQFNDIMFKQGIGNSSTKEMLQRQFGNTYWYYIHYILPSYKAKKRKKAEKPQEHLYILKADQ